MSNTSHPNDEGLKNGNVNGSMDWMDNNGMDKMEEGHVEA